MTHKFITLICIILLLNSCSKDESEDGYKKALNFHEKYTTEFFDSELNKFRYHPRTQYDFIINDSSSFRVLVKENNDLLIISPFGFAEMFNLPLDTNLLQGQATLKYENSDFVFEIDNYDMINYSISGKPIKKTIRTNLSYVFPKETIKNNPIAYFAKLEKLRSKFGIVNYYRAFDSEVTWIYFTSFDYLIFIPDNFQFDKKYKDHLEEELKKGKKLDENWYYFKTDEPLDVG